MDIAKKINELGDKLSTNAFVAPIVRNPLWVALLITAMVLIVIATYGNCEISRCSKPAFWIFVTTALVLTLHNSVMVKEIRAYSANEDRGSFVRDISGRGEGRIPVVNGSDEDFDLSGGGMFDEARAAAQKAASDPRVQAAAIQAAQGALSGKSSEDIRRGLQASAMDAATNDLSKALKV